MTKQAFTFHFKNPVQDSGSALTNVLFINDAPAESDILKLGVELLPDLKVGIHLKPVADKEASATNYHARLTFGPDTLAKPEAIVLSAADAELWDVVCIPETRAADGEEETRAIGEVHFYLLHKGSEKLVVNRERPLILTLQKVGASPVGGTRGTQVQLTWNDDVKVVEIDKIPDPGEYNLTERADLDLLARRTQSGAPLSAGFVTSDVVLNDGSTKNYLLLRIVNTGPLPIPLSPAGSPSPSKFSLGFDVDSSTEALWALALAAQVASIFIPGKKDSSGTDASWPGHANWTVARQSDQKTWTLTPKATKTSLAPGEAIEVPISNIVTGHATGRTALRIGYVELAGYNDGELVAFIQKYPLIFAGPKVGIGTGSPSEKLTVETDANAYGITHTDGKVTLSTRLVLIGSQETGTRAAALGTRTNHALCFYTHSNVVTGGVLSPAMTLTTEGKLGIGTTAPIASLEVRNNGGPGIVHTRVSTGGEKMELGTYIDDGGCWLGTLSSHDLKLRAGGVGGDPLLALTTGGKVGIGTDSPSTKLTVHTSDYDGITHTNNTVSLTTRVTNSGGRLGTLGKHSLSFFTEGNDRMTLAADGKIGIGISSPSFPLEVRTGARQFGFTHTYAKSATETVQLASYVDDKGGWLGTRSVHDLHFYTRNGDPRMTLKTDGKVGIGTTNPQATLDVNGTFMIKGAKPIAYVEYEIYRDNPRIVTDYKSSEWIAIIGGFYVNHTEDEPTHMRVWPYANPSGLWQIECDVGNATESRWIVKVAFIRRELVR